MSRRIPAASLLACLIVLSLAAVAAQAASFGPAPSGICWIRNDSQILRDGTVVVSDEEIGTARLSPDGKWLAYSRAKSDIVVVNLASGQRSVLVSRKTSVTLFGTAAAESTGVYPVGFTPDGTRLYFVYQAHSVFAGGNVLYSMSTRGGKPEVIDKGVQHAAVSKTGDLIILVPGSVRVAPAAGGMWEHSPSIRSLFIQGVGFSEEGTPFYFSDDSVRLFDRAGKETKLSATARSAPIVAGDVVISDDGRRLTCNKAGVVEGLAGLGQNRSPFK